MSFYITGNPVPSIDPRDLDDNAKHIDEIVNSTELTFTDRLGTERQTMAGIIEGNNSLAANLANQVDPAKGDALIGHKGSTLAKALGSLELSVTIHAQWPAQPGLSTNAVITLCESLGGGVVMIPPGDFTYETGVNLTRRVVVRGSGKNTTLTRWGQTGPLFKFQPASFSPGSHAVEDLTVTNISGPIISGSVGFELSDTYGFGLRRISIANLDTDIRLRNRNFWTEGTIIEDFNMFHCNNGLTFARDPAPATGTDSFATTNISGYASEASAGGNCMVIGDDAISTRGIRVYNSHITAFLWHKAGAAAVKWGANATIVTTSGSVLSEGFDGAANLQPGLNLPLNGPHGFSGEWITNDGGRTAFDQFTKRMDFRAVKFRDMGQSGSGGLQSPAKWFKCVNLTQSKGNISGSLQVSGAYGGAGSYSAVADFFFGRGGATRRPAFSVTGDAFSGTGSGTPRLVWVRDDTTLDESLWFYRPPFTNVALFSYQFDPYLEGRVGSAGEGIGLQEMWVESATPIGVAGTTVLYDTQNAFPSQQMYCGDEFVFSGQRYMLTTNGDGTTKDFFFTHGLGAAPEWYEAVAASADAVTAKIASYDLAGGATDVRIRFAVAPVVGTGNVVISVSAGRKSWRRSQRPAT